MGDTRFRAPYNQIRRSQDKPADLAGLPDEEVVQALAHASREREPFLANILATEAVNRIRRASAITAHMAEGAFAIDDHLRLTYVNPALGRMTGRPSSELVGTPVLEAWAFRDKNGRTLPDEERPCVVARDTRAPVEIDVITAPPQRPPFPALVHVTPILDEGEVVALVGSIRDLSAERLAEERVRGMLDRAPFAAFTLDANGTFVDANPAGARLIGRKRDEIIGQPFHPFLDEADRELALADFARVLNGEIRVHEYNLRRGDGTILRACVTGVPMRQGDRIVGMHGFAEPVVGQGEAWFRVLADSAPVMIWMSGADARCTYFNRGWLAFTGRTLQDELGNGWTQGIHADDRERCLQHYLSHFERREPFELEYRLRRGDGTYAWILDHGVPRYDYDGEFLGYVGSGIDISAHKELERDLDERVAERTARLTRALRDVETFTTSASHDLRAPLRGVDVLLQAVAEDYGEQLPPGASALLARARRENKRAATLVLDLLAFTRSGHQEIAPRSIDVATLCREITQDIARAHPDWRTGWTLGPIPPVRADEGLLRVALYNLLDNAAKYTSRATPSRVRIDAETDGQEWRIHVQDNGPGFDARQAGTLFQPFHRLSNAQGYEGTGLGLATVQRVAQRHGGRVSAEGRPGEGATFTLSLPA